MNNIAAYMASIQQAFTNVNSSIAGLQNRVKVLEEMPQSPQAVAQAPAVSEDHLNELKSLISALEARLSQFESVVDTKIKQAITVVLEGLASAATGDVAPVTETVDVVGGTLNLDDGVATAAPAPTKKAVTRKTKAAAA